MSRKEPARRPRKRPSTQDIATILNISRSTVIRALANDPKIKDETIARVNAVANHIGYRKNSIAGSMRSGRTGIIGCLVPNVSNPYFADMVTHISAQLAMRGMGMLLGVTNDDLALEQKYVSTFMNYLAEGVLLSNSRIGFFSEHILELRDQHVPVVIFGDGAAVRIDSIGGDDESGAFQMMCFLKENGYARISFLYAPGFGIEPRLNGYKRGLLENGLPYVPEAIVGCSHLSQVGPAVDRLLRLPEPPDAIFASHDYLAIEILHVVSRLGLTIPGDIAVVGFDNISLGEELTPPLTTVDLCTQEVIEMGIDLLLKKIESGARGEELPDSPQHLKLQPKIVVRGSTRVRSGVGDRAECAAVDAGGEGE